MPSPLFDTLSIRLSRELGDPVAAAATDGKRWSSAQRSSFLNAGIRAFILKAVKYGNWGALTGLVAEEAKALVANVLTLATTGGWTGGVSWIMSAYNVTDNLPIKPLLNHNLRSFVKTGGSQFLVASATNQYWVKDGLTFRLLDGVANSTDSIELRYVKQHTDLTAGFATDIPVGSEYFEEVLDLAVSIGLIEMPKSENVARSVVLEQQVEKNMAQSSGVIGNA